MGLHDHDLKTIVNVNGLISRSFKIQYIMKPRDQSFLSRKNVDRIFIALSSTSNSQQNINIPQYNQYYVNPSRDQIRKKSLLMSFVRFVMLHESWTMTHGQNDIKQPIMTSIL